MSHVHRKCRPNHTFACERCGVVRSVYVRPCKPAPRFCSRLCAGKANASASPTVKAGRKRALKAYPGGAPCQKCGAPRSERHHIDGNTANNAPENIARLCRRCHMRADGRLAKASASMRQVQPLGVAARWP